MCTYIHLHTVGKQSPNLRSPAAANARTDACFALVCPRQSLDVEEESRVQVSCSCLSVWVCFVCVLCV